MSQKFTTHEAVWKHLRPGPRSHGNSQHSSSQKWSKRNILETWKNSECKAVAFKQTKDESDRAPTLKRFLAGELLGAIAFLARTLFASLKQNKRSQKRHHKITQSQGPRHFQVQRWRRFKRDAHSVQAATRSQDAMWWKLAAKRHSHSQSISQCNKLEAWSWEAQVFEIT